MPKKFSELPELLIAAPDDELPILDVSETQDIDADGFVDKNKRIKIRELARFSGGLTYFGTGADGAVNSTGDITPTATLDGDPVVLNYTSLTLNQNHTLQTNQRCKGLLIYVDGDCTIDGKISMSGLGASALGQVADYTVRSRIGVSPAWSQYIGSQTIPLPLNGAAGGTGQSSTSALGPKNGNNGSAGTSGATGGGGGGGSIGTSTGSTVGGTGGTGTSFSGGTGGGARCNNSASALTGNAGGANGGAGGAGITIVTNFGAGGGAGNPGGAGASNGTGIGDAGASGTGGVLILVVRGNLTIGATGIIEANGANGGNASPLGAGGGGSGGGRVIVLYGGTLVNNGSLTANGGSGGTGTNGSVAANGGNGGAGSVTIEKIS